MGFIGIIILFLPKDLSWTLVADWPAQLLILAGSACYPALLCVLGLGLGSTAIATITYLWVIDTVGPSVMARINYFVPVCSVILGVALLNETLDWRIFVSLFVILIGVIISRFGGKART